MFQIAKELLEQIKSCVNRELAPAEGEYVYDCFGCSGECSSGCRGGCWGSCSGGCGGTCVGHTR